MLNAPILSTVPLKISGCFHTILVALQLKHILDLKSACQNFMDGCSSVDCGKSWTKIPCLHCCPFTLCDVPSPDNVSSRQSMLFHAKVVQTRGWMLSGIGISLADAIF